MPSPRPRPRPRRLAALLVPVVAAVGLPTIAAPSPPATDALAALFGRLHDEGRFDGTVLVAEGGVIVFEESYGLADAAAGEPITAATRFDVAAVAKPIVATAALVLVERGVLALDEPVAAHVPEFPWPDITVRHLLTHTSGLLDQGTLYEGYGARVDASGVVTNAGVLDLLATAKPPLTAPPGTRLAESDVNDIVLVTVLERADGRDIRTLLRETVFAPAGMRDTDAPPVRPPGAPRPEGVAEDYVRVGIAPDGRQAWAPSRRAFGWEFIATLSGTVGDGGIFSTARDLLRFDRALRDGTLLRAETLAAAYAPARDRDGVELWTTDEPPTSHGLGWRLAESGDSVSYAGDWGGFQAGVVRRLADDRVVIYLMNRRTDDRSWLGPLDAILDDPARAPTPAPAAGPVPRPLAPAEVAENTARLRPVITETPGDGGDAGDAAFADRVDAVVRAYHAAGAFDGAVLVIRDGAVAYTGAFGLANHAWSVPSAPDTRFPICSITKQFTAFLVVQLAGEGRIDLDAPILRHLPWYRADTGARITVRHLLQHMSGLPEPVTTFDEIDDALAVAGDTRAAITRFCSGDPTFEPGTAFTYSNADYHVLGAIIEETTGRPWADVLRTRILEPLGMRDTGVLRHQVLVPRLAAGIDRTGDELRLPMQFAALGGAAAGMYSTVEDLGAWNLALLEHRLLPRDLTEAMFTPAVVEGVTGNYVALGSWVYRRPLPPDNAIAPRLVERRGHIAPYTGLNVLCPDEGHAFVILSNALPVDLETLPYASGLPLDLLLLVTGREPEGPAPN